MRKNLVLTLTGHDRIGIVEQITKLVMEKGGNVEISRMTRLGGEFVMLLLVSLEQERYEEFSHSTDELRAAGYTLTLCPTVTDDPARFAGWIPYQVEVRGADHEGIIHHIAFHLAEHGIHIENMDTSSLSKAPMSGTPLFTMAAVVLMPPHLHIHDLQEDLKIVGEALNVDIEMVPYAG
jgi:glycine cleavage system transcriptional repressor